MPLQTTYGDLSPRIGAHAEKQMLAHAEPILVLNKLGMPKQMPTNTGETIKFRRPIPLPVATTPLVEGVTPPPTAFRYEDVEATLNEYGDWMELTNKITDLHEDSVGKDMAMMAGEQAAETIEMITYGVVKSGTNVIYAGGAGSRADVASPLTLREQRLATRVLMANRAKRLTSILDSSPKYATRAIEAAFVGVVHTDIASSIRNMKGFVPVADYGNRQTICSEEIGSVEDVRYITSPLFDAFADAGGAAGEDYLSTDGTQADVYPVMIFAKEAFAVIALKGTTAFGGAIKPMVRNPGKADSNDPMGRSGSVAWRTWYVSKILNDSWMVRIECAGEANPAA